ncbi:diacylglycerol kinase family protein [Methylocella sp.]|uniref:diacylglycerol kinase family protein n=1 Tax=Methylocella sp. TaxID=1978226 RepID=UPI003782D33B
MSVAAAQSAGPAPFGRGAGAKDPPPIRSAVVVVNEAGGGVSSGAAGELAEIFARFSIEARIRSVPPSGLAEAVRAAVAARPDLVVTLAGDGTARQAAKLCGRDGPLVAPLAGGTMNMLPYALYGRRPWREALEAALADPLAWPVPGGRAGARPFYVAAILGSPALWAPAREAMRRGKLSLALARRRRACSRRPASTSC